jgi:hypothetical protein
MSTLLNAEVGRRSTIRIVRNAVSNTESLRNFRLTKTPRKIYMCGNLLQDACPSERWRNYIVIVRLLGTHRDHLQGVKILLMEERSGRAVWLTRIVLF